MLQLLVMRHAKSDWGAPFTEDHDRPLAARGVKAARRMGRLLSELGVAPDHVMTSTAVRAVETAELAARAGGWRCSVDPTRLFYTEAAAGILAELARAPAVDSLMVVGHEPTWSALVALLLGGGTVRMSTAAVACLEFGAAAWSEVTSGTGRLCWLVDPRLVAAVRRARKM